MPYFQLVPVADCTVPTVFIPSDNNTVVSHSVLRDTCIQENNARPYTDRCKNIYCVCNTKFVSALHTIQPDELLVAFTNTYSSHYTCLARSHHMMALNIRAYELGYCIVPAEAPPPQIKQSVLTMEAINRQIRKIHTVRHSEETHYNPLLLDPFS